MSVIMEEKVEPLVQPSKTLNKKVKKSQNRPVTHLIMLVTSIIACILAAIYRPEADISETISIGTGYYALLLMAITLLIGPYKLLRQRRNPVNIDLRRDIGIWAGINTLIHVFFSFQLFQKGQVLLYFLTQTGGVRTDIFGVSNDIGLVSFLVILPVLFTSNQISLKLMKGKRWKGLQRLTYLVFAFGLLHTIGFQFYNVREAWFSVSTVIATMGVLVAQSIGIAITIVRNRQRKLSNTEVSPITNLTRQPVKIAIASNMARRQFLKIGAGAFITGVAAGTAISLLGTSQEKVASATVAENTTAVSTATATPANTATTSAATASVPTTASAISKTATTTASGVTILATTATLATGKALLFTTPDNQRAFVVHRKDGSVGCFGGVCTHEPVNLVFNESSQSLYCPRHDVSFDTQNGNPSSMPARTALKKYAVKVDSNGNIIYG